MQTEKKKAIVGIITVILLFVLSSYLVRTNLEFLQNSIGNSYWGVGIYFLIAITATVIAPISMMPLVPIAANLWGWFNAGILNVVGWTLGAIIVFFICRRYGVSLIKKFVSLEKINKFESKIPEKNMFINIVLLRMMIPVDILSYAIGLFTKVKFKIYALATMIGTIPLAFAVSYLGTIPWYFQVLGFFIIGLIIAIMYEFYKK